MANKEKLKQLVCKTIDAFVPQLKALSQDIWSHPELCFQEKYAHQRITQFLETTGFIVEKSFKLETAFRARPASPTLATPASVTVHQGGNDGANIAMLCEYDALPEIGHACGHNLIAIVGLAASLAIRAVLQSSDFNGSGKLTVLGTPAEEGGGGKIDLIHAGAFSDIDVAMMAHPSQFNLQKPVFLAMTQVKIKFQGRASHASSFPWEGVNALDAAVQCYTNISHFRQQMRPTWRAHGIITNGGAAPNIIPETSELLYFLRAPTDGELTVLKERVIGCIQGAATATGCTVIYEFDAKAYSSLMSNDILANLYVENCLKLGIQPETDPEKIRKAGGSTDMGNVSHIIPSLHPKYFIGTTVSAHTPEFATHSKTDEAEAYSLAAAKALAMTAVDLYLSPDLLQQTKETFRQQLEAEKVQC